MHKLYDISFSSEVIREKLYCKSRKFSINNSGQVFLPQGEELDCLTYFNSFSLCKWKKYTTLQNISIHLRIKGKAKVSVVGLTTNGKKNLKASLIEGYYEESFDVKSLDVEIIGLEFVGLTDCLIIDATYYGSFAKWQDRNIGIVICTYKREKYIKNTMELLRNFIRNNKWLDVLIVDNGSTLKEKNEENIRVTHNPNYGGSGGFTRGLLENSKRNKNDYILFMDDDVELELSTIYRTHSLLCGIKKEYKDSFVAGSMLSLENPYIQYEKVGRRDFLRGISYGRDYDLSKVEYLFLNEQEHNQENQFAAWWYCCMPIDRINNLGLPLPLFIKGDDIEYSIRNNRPIISMNGIGVWHEDFKRKSNALTCYFSARNMLIVNMYMKKTSRFKFCISLIARICRCVLLFKASDIFAVYEAVKDFSGGLVHITKEKPQMKIEALGKRQCGKNIILTFLLLLKVSIISVARYDQLHSDYENFRNEKLQDDKFWRNYMNIL